MYMYCTYVIIYTYMYIYIIMYTLYVHMYMYLGKVRTGKNFLCVQSLHQFTDLSAIILCMCVCGRYTIYVHVYLQ